MKKRLLALSLLCALLCAQCVGAFAAAASSAQSNTQKYLMPIDVEEQYLQYYESVRSKIKKLYNFYGDDLETAYDELLYIDYAVRDMFTEIDSIDTTTYFKNGVKKSYNYTSTNSNGNDYTVTGEYAFSSDKYTDTYSYTSPESKQKITSSIIYYATSGRCAYTLESSNGSQIIIDFIRAKDALYIQTFEHRPAYVNSAGEKVAAKTYADRMMLKSGSVYMSMKLIDQSEIKDLRLTKAPASWSAFAHEDDWRYEFANAKLKYTYNGRTVTYD